MADLLVAQQIFPVRFSREGGIVMIVLPSWLIHRQTDIHTRHTDSV